jgi:hypothetical protein
VDTAHRLLGHALGRINRNANGALGFFDVGDGAIFDAAGGRGSKARDPQRIAVILPLHEAFMGRGYDTTDLG